VEGELIVKFKDGTTPETMDEVNSRLKTSVKRNLADLTFLLSIDDPSSVEEKTGQYKSEESVEYAEGNYIVTTQPVGEPQPFDPVTTEPFDGGEAPQSDLNPTGSKKMFFYTGETNFENEEVAVTGDSDTIEASTQEFEVALPRELSPDGAEQFTFDLDGRGIRFKPQIENTSIGVIVDNSVLYEDVFAGIDLRFVITEDGLKEEFVLKSAPASNTFSFDFELYGDIYFTEENKKIIFYDSNTNKALFSLPSLFMYDAINTFSFDIETKLTNTADKLKLEYLLDDTWLTDPARVYPIIVDPPVTIETSAAPGYGDTFISQASPNKNNSLSDELWVGYDGSGRNYTLLKFDTSKIQGTIIYSAYLDLILIEGIAGNVQLDAVNSGSSYSPGNITWQNSGLASGFWSTQAFEMLSEFVMRFDIKDIVQMWADGTENNGFLLHSIDDGKQAEFKKFLSAEYIFASRGPKLEVFYNNQPKVAAVSPDNRHEKSLSEYRFNYSDPDGDAINFAYIEVATNSNFDDGTVAGKPRSIVETYGRCKH
ncbi:hypothetical protein LCGC14_0983080, partial [marine sediment metagenome]